MSVYRDSIERRLRGQKDSRSTQGIMSRGANVYNGGSNAAQRGGGSQFGRPSGGRGGLIIGQKAQANDREGFEGAVAGKDIVGRLRSSGVKFADKLQPKQIQPSGQTLPGASPNKPTPDARAGIAPAAQNGQPSPSKGIAQAQNEGERPSVGSSIIGKGVAEKAASAGKGIAGEAIRRRLGAKD